MPIEMTVRPWRWIALVEGLRVLVLLAALGVSLWYGFYRASNSQNPAADPNLNVILPGGARALSLSELKRALKPQTMTVQDYADYDGATKTYEGFLLKDVLNYAGLAQAGGDVVRLEALDGFASRLAFDKLQAPQPVGLIAFREVGQAEGWEMVKKGSGLVSPGPYYLVWAGADGPASDEARKRPWPYQLATIRVVDFKKTYNLIYPENVAENDPIYRGFDLFARGGYDGSPCLDCHALNQQGGTVGPELNIPKNITEYRDDSFLVAWIKNSKSFRVSSDMAAFENRLTDAQIQDILAYLRWMRDRKVSPK
jgi:hypothetical protein